MYRIFFANVIGVAFSCLVMVIALNFGKNILIVTTFFLTFFSCYYYELIEKLFESQRQKLIDQQLLSIKRKTQTNVIFYIASKIDEGISKKSLKIEIKKVKALKDIFKDIYLRAYCAVYPNFTDKKYLLKISIYFYVLIMVRAGIAILVCFGILYMNVAIFIISGLLIIITQHASVKFWLRYGNYHFPSTLIFSFKNKNTHHTTRGFLLQYLLNSALIKLKCEPIEGNAIRINFLDDESKNIRLNECEMDLTINNEGIKLTEFTGDHRQPYYFSSFNSFDEFFLKFIVDRAYRENGNEVILHPKILPPLSSRVDQNSAKNHHTDKLKVHINLIVEYRNLQKILYEKLMAGFIKSFQYQIIKFCINSSIK